MDNDRLPAKVLVFLLTVSLLPIEMLILPAELVSKAQNESIFALIGGAVLAALAITLIATLMQRYPGQGLFEISRDSLGPVIGTIVSLAYAVFWLLMSAGILRGVAEMVRDTLLAFTPKWATMLFMSLGAVYLAVHGIEPIGRLAQLTVPIVLAIVLLFLMGTIYSGEITRAQPFLEPGAAGRIMDGAIHAFHSYCGSSSLLVLGQFVHPTHSLLAASLTGIGLSTAFFALALVTTLTILGTAGITMYHWPLLVSVQNLRIPTFLVEKVDSFFLAEWVMFTYISLVLMYVVSGLTMKKVLRLRSNLWPTLGIAVLAYLIGLIPKHYEHYISFNDEWLCNGIYGVPFSFLLPVFMLIVSIIRNRRHTSGKTVVPLSREQRGR